MYIFLFLPLSSLYLIWQYQVFDMKSFFLFFFEILRNFQGLFFFLFNYKRFLDCLLETKFLSRVRLQLHIFNHHFLGLRKKIREQPKQISPF